MVSFSRVQACRFREEKYRGGSVGLGVFLCLVSAYIGLLAGNVLPRNVVDKLSLGLTPGASRSISILGTESVTLSEKLDSVLDAIERIDGDKTKKPSTTSPKADASAPEAAERVKPPQKSMPVAKRNSSRKSLFSIDPSLVD